MSVLELALRVVGVSHIALALAHVGIWRAFDWTREIARLSPLTARVFAVHTFFVAFVLAALGALLAFRADLVTTSSDFARLVLGFGVAFWCLRLLAQPLVFDPVFLVDKPRLRTPLRAAALLGFAAYVGVYAWALAQQ